MDPAHYEKLGVFYLGGLHTPGRGTSHEEALLYDARDLTTHAVCVGMTGSGKTGLCLALLEEAAIDGIPAIAIDPKGDLGNLMLAFPDLEPADFRPWINEDDAARKGITPDVLAAQTAGKWKAGLAQWSQEPSRIARFRDAADVAIYTPGSDAGLPISVLRSFAAPGEALLDDKDAMRDRVSSNVSGLLSLLGVDADPIRSREHILVANIVDRAWRKGQDLSLADLIREIQKPPFEQIGVFDLESFFPAKERLALAMTLNNLLASPGFAAWMEGEPLDVGALLFTKDGRPRISILSIAHLADAERMFFVTLVLNEVASWMRSQSGTTSLRAILYMDEVAGYLPPVANPPSKAPMLRLLKQARAFGVGVVLATQNPVDVDYKALSNAGTWLLGRLQTERDKMRVLEGLEGASSAAGRVFDRARMEQTLAGLASRTFVMNNVHDDQPVIFESRWALSYLAGPLTRIQIRTLMGPRKAPKARATGDSATQGKSTKRAVHVATAPAAARPAIPATIDEVFLAADGAGTGRIVYRPALLGSSKLHYVDAKSSVDVWHAVHFVAPLEAGGAPDPWDGSEELDTEEPAFADGPVPGASFAALPAAAANPKTLALWTKSFAGHLYRARALALFRCRELKLISAPEESQSAFAARVAQKCRELRDADVAKLRARYAPKVAALEERIRRAEGAVDVQKEQLRNAEVGTAVSFGSTLLGALFGRRSIAGNVSRAGSAVRGVSRAASEKSDVGRAEATVAALRQQLDGVSAEFEAEAAGVAGEYSPHAMTIERVDVPPRKADIAVDRVALAWVPYRAE